MAAAPERLIGRSLPAAPVTVTVEMTWRPRLLVPVTATVVRSPSTLVTSPVKVRCRGVPGDAEFQRDRPTRAAGPASSVTNRSTRPVSVRMLTKMSLDPRCCARSRSWCTSWKSRVARAVETTKVGVRFDREGGRARSADSGARSAGFWPARRDLGLARRGPRRSSTNRRGSARQRGNRGTHTHGHADLHVGGIDVAQFAEHPYLGQLDQRHDERQCATGHARGVVHDVKLKTVPSPRDVVGGGVDAVVATSGPRRRNRRVLQRPVRYALDAQPAGGNALPEKTRCPSTIAGGSAWRDPASPVSAASPPPSPA